MNDFREQIERTRILRTMFRSASALKCRLQTIASISRASVPASSMMVSRAAQTGVAGVGAIWRPVSRVNRYMNTLIVLIYVKELCIYYHIMCIFLNDFLL